ncbi:hypothetical protein AB0F88_16265 [Streptosporangium sp. NPDC023963]|uniref:hypothetical protein n=1 Tax=Streptosporangium sp. NPDC023963 TaxID=3155608 RepID=UPI0034490C5B
MIDVVDRPAGVKLHVPARSTEATAALPAVKPSRSPAAAATDAVDSDAVDSDAVDSDAVDSDAVDSDAVDSDDADRCAATAG